MNSIGLVGALLPVFFVLALGYLAGERHSFNVVQAAGSSKLALGYALPAALFVSMTDIRRDPLLQQGELVPALLISHLGLFLIAWICFGRIPALRGNPFNAVLDRFTVEERLLEIKQQRPGDRCDVDGELSYSTAT